MPDNYTVERAWKGDGMDSRNGEKTGWIGGWSGSFVWLLILAILLYFKGQTVAGLVGVALLAVAAFCIYRFAPWKNPATPYWKLLLPIYGVLIVSLTFVFTVGLDLGYGFRWQWVFWLMPMMIPFFTMGRRTWEQGKPPINSA